jgi:hypothetical protein
MNDSNKSLDDIKTVLAFLEWDDIVIDLGKKEMKEEEEDEEEEEEENSFCSKIVRSSRSSSLFTKIIPPIPLDCPPPESSRHG